MKKITDKLVAFLPEDSIEPQALVQLKNTTTMPFIYKHVAAMPDCHLGMGSTVGSVIATDGAIMPAAVGVDIGCGMIAVKTKFNANEVPDNLESMRTGIERRIPLGAGGRNQKITKTAEGRIAALDKQAGDEDYQKFADWRKQLGSLGSGNHFVEVCLDETDQVWLVLHSGSRGVGNQIAQKHIKIAQKLMDKYYIELVDNDLAYLVEDTQEFKDYIRDMLWAQDFAMHNRDEMMDRVLTEISYQFYGEDGHQGEIELERINCHHNFTQKEHHMGKNVWVTRKGAIQMQEGQLGVIPGSMGTHSYIVEGLGNVLSFKSAPHGAGRRFSRSEARRRFTMEDFERELKGIEVRYSEQLIDEIPSAYKSIDEVMENAKDLVKVKHELRQIVNVKGN
jgi:tRNA-splicing ligase RtcB